MEVFSVNSKFLVQVNRDMVNKKSNKISYNLEAYYFKIHL
jgi:hypothetical protein